MGDFDKIKKHHKDRKEDQKKKEQHAAAARALKEMFGDSIDTSGEIPPWLSEDGEDDDDGDSDDDFDLETFTRISKNITPLLSTRYKSNTNLERSKHVVTFSVLNKGQYFGPEFLFHAKTEHKYVHIFSFI